MSTDREAPEPVRRPVLFPCAATGMAMTGFTADAAVRDSLTSAPSLLLLVMVAIGLVRGSRAGAVAGFCCGLLTDLAPATAHAAGTGALAYCLAGHLAGALRADEGADGRGTVLRQTAVVAAAGLTVVGVFTTSAVVLGVQLDHGGVLGMLAETTAPTVLAGVPMVPALTGVLRRC